MLPRRVTAAILAVMFSAAPFAFMLCGVNCAHAIAKAKESHACHETESAPVSGTTIRGVPPPCTHVDADDRSASRIETIFIVALPLDLIRTPVLSAPAVAWFADADAGSRTQAPPPRVLQLRV